MTGLSDKAVIITGAGRGLGAAYARLAAREGASVMVADIDAAPAIAVADEISATGGIAAVRVVDVSDWRQAESLIRSCVSEFGRLDGLVNNAGYCRLELPTQMDEGELAKMWQANVRSTAACGTFAMRQMAEQGAGSIVNVVSGAHLGMRYMASYGATKAAVASFTYSWSLELRGTGVRVNAVSPLARTRMVADTAAFMEANRVGAIDYERTPEPSASAPLVAYLLSDAARDISGQVIRIEGPQLSLMAHPVVLDPVIVTDGDWSVDGIAAAFAGVLAERQVPVGAEHVLKAEYLAGSAPLWDGSKRPPEAPGGQTSFAVGKWDR